MGNSNTLMCWMTISLVCFCSRGGVTITEAHIVAVTDERDELSGIGATIDISENSSAASATGASNNNSNSSGNRSTQHGSSNNHQRQQQHQQQGRGRMPAVPHDLMESHVSSEPLLVSGTRYDAGALHESDAQSAGVNGADTGASTVRRRNHA